MDFCLHYSLSSIPLPQYQLLDLEHPNHCWSYLFQLVFSLEAMSFLQDWFQADTQRKAAEQWACFPPSSFCYDFRGEICWWSGGWTDLLNQHENLLILKGIRPNPYGIIPWSKEWLCIWPQEEWLFFLLSYMELGMFQAVTIFSKWYSHEWRNYWFPLWITRSSSLV